MTTIRPATAADLPALCALADTTCVCRPDSRDSIWLAEADGRPQGDIACRHVLDEIELLALAVVPAARRQGIATALHQVMLSALAPAVAYLEVRADNHEAQALYRRLGYRDSGQRKAYYANPDGSRTDALLMTLHIPE